VAKTDTLPNYPKEYLEKIRTGKEIVSNKVRAVYEREVGWMEKPPADFPFYFDEKEGLRHIEFIERFCKHSKGRFAGKSIQLELFQKAKIQLAFGWRWNGTKLRRYREVVDIRARKCGKSTETAAVEWDVFLNDHENGPEVYCTANKKDQANLIYSECVNMRIQSPELKAITKKRQSDIYCPGNMGFIKCLASDTSTMDGLNPSFFSLDECHAMKTSALYDVMLQGQSMREQPLAWIITTNGFIREGFFDDKYAYWSSVATWEPGFEDYTVLPLIYELNDRGTWADPAHWPEANPGLGKIKKLETLRDNVEKAKRDPTFLPTLLTKDFNLPESEFATWLSYEEAVNEQTFEMDYIAHSYAIGGCDLSAVGDLTCATLLVQKPGDANVYVLQKYFIPQSKVDSLEKTASKEAPYKLWAKQGWLHICQGAQVNYSDVTAWFLEMVEKYDIRPLWISYDRALSGYWVPEMEGYGFELEKCAQGPFTWNQPMREMQAAFSEKRVIYNNNPILRWCLLNTAAKKTKSDSLEVMQPVKIQVNRRIDGMVSLLNAWVGYVKHYDEYVNYLR
jgi:phage terminase large subunit-like protein